RHRITIERQVGVDGAGGILVRLAHPPEPVFQPVEYLLLQLVGRALSLHQHGSVKEITLVAQPHRQRLVDRRYGEQAAALTDEGYRLGHILLFVYVRAETDNRAR